MLIDKVIEFYVLIDDFNQEFEVAIKKHLLESKGEGKRNRPSQLSDAEVMSILLLFHYGQFTNMKSFYQMYVCIHLKGLFPDLVSYNRFVELQKKVAVPLMLFLKHRALGKSTVSSVPLMSERKMMPRPSSAFFMVVRRTFDGWTERKECWLIRKIRCSLALAALKATQKHWIGRRGKRLSLPLLIC